MTKPVTLLNQILSVSLALWIFLLSPLLTITSLNRAFASDTPTEPSTMADLTTAPASEEEVVLVQLVEDTPMSTPTPTPTLTASPSPEPSVVVQTLPSVITSTPTPTPAPTQQETTQFVTMTTVQTTIVNICHYDAEFGVWSVLSYDSPTAISYHQSHGDVLYEGPFDAELSAAWCFANTPNDAPVVATHADVIETTSSVTGKIVAYTNPTATDTYGDIVTVACTPASGTNFALGTTPVTCTATDSYSATDTTSFNVTLSYVDTIAPPVPTGLHRDNVSRTQSYSCGALALRQTLIPDWDDIADDPTFSHFEYSSFNADGSQGLNERVLYTSEFVHSWVPTADGTYGFSVRSVDTAGNKSAWALSGETRDGSCQITYDSTAPVVSLTSPTTPNLSGTVAIRGSAQDLHPQTYRVIVQADEGGADYGPGSYVIDTTSFSNKLLYTWDTTTAPNGGYTIIFVAIDELGNQDAGSVAIYDVTIDNTSPTANIHFPTVGFSATSFQVQFSKPMNFAEAENPANYFLTNWPTAGGSGDLVGDATVSYNSETYTSTVTFTNPGWYLSPEQLWGVQNVHDTFGNLLLVNPYTEYTTPLIAPTTTDAGTSSGWVNTDVVVTFTCNDGTLLVDASGCYRTWYRINGGSWTQGSSFTLTTDGSYTIEYYSEDNAGNIESSKLTQYSVNIDKTAPVISVNGVAEPGIPDLVFDESNVNSTHTYSFSVTAAEGDTAELTGIRTVVEPLAVECNFAPAGFDYPVGTSTVICTTVDRAGNDGSAEFTVTVNNLTPTVLIAAHQNANDSYTFTAAPTGGNLPYTYLWSGNCSGTGISSTTGTAPGTYNCTVTVTDTDGDSATASISRTIPSPAVPQTVLGTTTEDEPPAETPTPTPTVTPTGEVLGERTCDEKKKLTGILFVDVNGSNSFDEAEQVFANVTGKITYSLEGTTITAGSFISGNNGRFTLDVCPGEYVISLNVNSIPAGYKVTSASQSVNVLGEQAETTVLFELSKIIAKSSFTWLWLLLVPFTLVVWTIVKKRQNSSQ